MAPSNESRAWSEQRGSSTSPLLTWYWLGALALLLLNDRLLKGSGWVPAWLTGKLSDLAGLFLAPVLLAELVVLFTRRRTPGLLAWSTLVTCAVFALLELSPQSAQLAERYVALLGLRWQVTPDLSDLWALPAAGFGFWVFTRHVGSFACSAGVRLLCERLLLALGVLACAASSDPGEPGVNLRPQSDAPVLVNVSSRPVVVRLQALRSDIAVFCESLAEDPGRSMPRTAFAPALRFTLAELQIFSLDAVITNRRGGCQAVLVQLDGREPRLVFWQDGDIEMRPLLSRAEREPKSGEGAILVDFDDEDQPEQFVDLHGGLVFDFEPAESVVGECSMEHEQWQVMAGFALIPRARIQSKTSLRDGCHRLELVNEPEPASDANGETAVAGASPAGFTAALGSFEQRVVDAGLAASGEVDAGDRDAAGETGDGGRGAREAGELPIDDGALDDAAEDDVADADAALVDAAMGSEDTPVLDGGAPPTDVVGSGDAGPVLPDAGSPGAPNGDGQLTPISAAFASGSPHVLSVCVPDEVFPFEAGDVVRISGSDTSPQIASEDGARRLTLFQRLQTGTYVTGGMEIESRDRFGCDYETSDEPTATRRAAELFVESTWGQFEVRQGEPHRIEEDELRIEVGLTAASFYVLGERPGIFYSGYLLREEGEP